LPAVRRQGDGSFVRRPASLDGCEIPIAATKRAMLREIYNWFTEGFETADLKDAKMLLDELNK
jgi:hypothetical protein